MTDKHRRNLQDKVNEMKSEAFVARDQAVGYRERIAESAEDLAIDISRMTQEQKSRVSRWEKRAKELDEQATKDLAAAAEIERRIDNGAVTL